MIRQPAAAAVAVAELRNIMEKPSSLPKPVRDYVHYVHTDACSLSRWTAKESYDCMYAKPWQKINDFYLDIVNGRRSLSELFRKEINVAHVGAEIVENFDKSELMSVPVEERTGKWARLTFKIVVSYHGGSFDGWQKQPGLNTVQEFIEKSLGQFVDERKAELLKGKKLPVDACVVVAGRTDKGVTALEQVCSFYTWRKDVKPQDVKDSVDGAAPEKLKVVFISQVSREFHPNFCAKWRRYVYIFPCNGEHWDGKSSQCKKSIKDNNVSEYGKSQECFDEKTRGYTFKDDPIEQEPGKKPISFEVSDVNRLLNQLEGKLLSYRMFARDTKASRNIGPPTECFMFHARAAEAYLSSSKDGNNTKIMCIELVANRFLRKMVRVLVATAIREAAAGAEEDALLKLMDATCRRATAPPAPPDGLCLVDVGYTEFDKNRCFIH